MRQDRERVVERIALVSCLVLAPFLAYGLLEGRLLQASAGVVLLAALMADALALRRLGQDMRHAPRPWKTSQNFPGLEAELAAGAPMEHP